MTLADAEPSDSASLLSLRDAVKTFGPVIALADGSLDLRAGEIHALMGENGTGKRTLVKILAGVHHPDAGAFTIAGEPVAFRSVSDSKAAGISVIYQEPTLLPDLSVAENIFVGRQPRGRAGLIDRPAMRDAAAALFTRLGVAIDPDRPAEGLSIADQQIIEIAKAISLDARVLVMDEPTAALSAAEAERLFTNRTFVVAVAAMLYGSDDQFDRVIRVIENYHDSLPEPPDRVRHTAAGEQSVAEAWRDVAVRLYVLGAEAVHQRKWSQLRRLVLHRYGPPDAYGYVSWLRHAITTAARAEVINMDDRERPRADAMISRALSLIAATPDLAPDVSPGRVDSATGVIEVTTALDQLCQFDVLWCTIAYADHPRTSEFYPSSAGFDQEHAFPAFELIVRDERVRHTLFPGIPDARVAAAIAVVADTGRQQSRIQPGFDWWSGLPDTVTAWIDANRL